MSPSELPPIRRIVTGHDAQGRSCIVEDGPCTSIRTVPERPGYRSVNVWRTTEAPARVDAPDNIAQHQGILPPGQGETLMKAGDVLIQRGTNHAWANRSDQMVRICFVLIDAQR